MIEPTNWWKTKIVMFVARITPRCHDMTRLISQSLDAPLPLGTRFKMWLHYRICVWCERYRDQLGFIGKALRQCDHEHGPKLPGDAKERLKRKLSGGP